MRLGALKIWKKNYKTQAVVFMGLNRIAWIVLMARRILISRRDWQGDASLPLRGGTWAVPITGMLTVRPGVDASRVGDVYDSGWTGCWPPQKEEC